MFQNKLSRIDIFQNFTGFFSTLFFFFFWDSFLFCSFFSYRVLYMISNHIKFWVICTGGPWTSWDWQLAPSTLIWGNTPPVLPKFVKPLQIDNGHLILDGNRRSCGVHVIWRRHFWYLNGIRGMCKSHGRVGGKGNYLLLSYLLTKFIFLYSHLLSFFIFANIIDINSKISFHNNFTK